MTMRRWGLGIVAAGLLTGCADNNVSIFVRQVQARLPGNECVATNDPESEVVLEGFYDVGTDAVLAQNGFQGALLWGNQLVPRADADRLLAESNRVQIYEAEIEVFDFSGATITSSVQPVTGFSDAAQGINPSYGLASVTLLDFATGASVAAGGQQVVVSRVRLRGETLGGLEVESGPFDFPITVCNNCSTVFVPASCDDEVVAACDPEESNVVDVRLLDPTFCAGSM